MAGDKRDAEFVPNQPPSAASIRSALLAAVLFALVILFVWYAAKALLVIFAGILLAVFLNALSQSLKRFVPVSALTATVIVIITCVGLTLAVIWLLAPRLAQQAAALYEDLPRAFAHLADSQVGREVTKFIPQVDELIQSAGGLMAPASWVFSTSTGVIVRAVIILFVGLYLALDPKRYIHGLLLLTPPNKRAQANDVLHSVAATLRRWTLARMLLMISNAILTSTGLWLLDVPFALTLGLIAGLLNFVPNLGPIIASIPAILIGLLESPSQAMYVALLYLGLQAADGYIFTPLVQQQAVSLPPALTIAAQLLMGVLLGAWGLLLATPLLAVSIVLINKLYVEKHDDKAPPGG